MSSVKQSTTRYCLQCRYALRGLSINECPECGRVFDPTDPRTTASHPQRDLWIAIAKIGRVLTLGIGIATGIAVVCSFLGFDWMMLLLGSCALTPLLFITIVIAVLPRPPLGWRYRVGSVALVALLLSVVFTDWPLRLSFLFHRAALDRYVIQIRSGAITTADVPRRVGMFSFVNVQERDGNIGFQTTGGGHGGQFFVCHDPNSNFIWVNTNWERDLGSSWFFVYQD